MHDLPGLRKKPAQERGWKRVGAILDAAAQLFADDGFDKTTMEAIAECAGTSIGSVYQFFEKKQDVFIALAHRCLDDVLNLSKNLTGAPTEALDWPELIDLSVDAIVAMAREHPGLRALSLNPQMYGLFEEADQAQGKILIEQAAAILPARIPTLSPAEAHRIATMIIMNLNAAIFFGSRSTDDEAAEIIAESKRMLRAYVATYI